jgi:hypothetical protein
VSSVQEESQTQVTTPALPWTRLTFTSGVELAAESNGVFITAGGITIWLTNKQLSAIGEHVREHLDHVMRGEVDTNSREWKRAYYGLP